jgi:hypothetical protein
MLPAELQSLLDQIDECEREAERLVAYMDDELVNRAPPPGGWSVAQCLEHLALINNFYLEGWIEAVDRAARAQQGPFRGLRPTIIGRWFARSMEPPVRRMKAKAVAQVTPGPRLSRDEVVHRYKASHDNYRHLVRTAASVDVNRIVRPNAIIKSVNMRLSTVLLILPAHDRRHLWQARQVKASLSTPAGELPNQPPRAG